MELVSEDIKSSKELRQLENYTRALLMLEYLTKVRNGFRYATHQYVYGKLHTQHCRNKIYTPNAYKHYWNKWLPSN